mgnify:FL=1|tara:strand:+ start:410 stop:691 length:282 start_codon:yes stop_codon:yes gene_type:complete
MIRKRTVNMNDERKYTITKQDNGWCKVEVTDTYGHSVEVYEKNLFNATRFVYEYWTGAEKRREKKELMHRAIQSCIKLDEESGRLRNNRDNLD